MVNNEGIDHAVRLLREKIPGNVLEYRAIMECLAAWSNPAAKLSRLAKAGALERVRTGLYVFGPSHRRRPLSLPSLANKILGPSYVSLEWALAYYGMIPEAAVAVTSVTLKRKRQYSTPVGRFIYEHIHPAAYSVGITWTELQAGSPALIATPEKALSDQLVIRIGKTSSLKQMETILFADLRVDEERLMDLDSKLLNRIYAAHPHSAVGFLIQYIERYQP